MAITQLKIITKIGDSLFINELESNLKSYLDWTLLGCGGWFNVNLPTSGIYGGRFDRLRFVDDPSYSSGQVWQGIRKDWVWETGVEWTGSAVPNTITGVTINGTGYTTGDASFGHHVNYPLGRIIFDDAIPTSYTVQLRHSYRWVQTYKADEVPWYRQLQFSSFRSDSSHIEQSSSGDWSIGGQSRIQMPCIVIEAVSRGRTIPHELGNGRPRLLQDVAFHVFAEDRWTRNNLLDIIRYQADKVIWLFNTNDINADNAYPLDYRGMLVGNKRYPDFVNPPESGGYRWKKCQFTNAYIAETEPVHPNLYDGIVRVTMELIQAI